MATDIGTYIKAENLPGDLLGRLEAVSLNSGANFLAGKASSAFAREKEAANNAMTAFNTITNPEVLKSISTDLIQHAVQVTTNRLSAYISEKTTELLDFKGMISTLTNSITYWTKESIISPQQILEEIKTIDIEKEIKKSSENAQKEGIENIKSNISGSVGKINEFYETNMSQLTNGLETITAYITNGPSWVISTVNSYVAQVINKVEGFVGAQVNSVISFRDKTIDTIGEKIGTGLAQPINTKAKNVAKKAKADSEKLISSVQTKAMNGIAQALMAVRKLTGIAIPNVFPKLPKLTSLF